MLAFVMDGIETGLLPATGAAVFGTAGLQALIEALAARGFAVHGPSVRDGAIVIAPIQGVTDLPSGWTERQEAGTYRLERDPSGALFAHTVGPQGWKRLFHPPEEVLFRARRTEGGFAVEAGSPAARPLALLGVRGCDLAGLARQDRILAEGPYADTAYAARRAGAFVVAVNCARAAATCFCVSMETGPRAGPGFDIALTELTEGGHRFVAEPGSARGAALLAGLPAAPARAADLDAARAVSARTAASMSRRLDTRGLKERLQAGHDDPRWDDVAARCLHCANCTMVCPTCFCTSVSDHTDLAGTEATRVKRWDSCFTADFSYLHGGPVRPSPKARYRQWLTHKLAHWIDQFGTSGCVGCGRCIAWCPAGIDITEEAAAVGAAGGPDGNA
jgi:ferredoxin